MTYCFWFGQYIRTELRRNTRASYAYLLGLSSAGKLHIATYNLLESILES